MNLVDEQFKWKDNHIRKCGIIEYSCERISNGVIYCYRNENIEIYENCT